MIFRRGFLFYKFFNIRLFFHIIFNKYDILVANDLDTLLPNFIVSKIKRLPLVCMILMSILPVFLKYKTGLL
jgi:hypothetical protein